MATTGGRTATEHQPRRLEPPADMTTVNHSPAPVPARIVARALRPFQVFARTEAAGGIVLLTFTALALVWANSPAGDSYFHFWELPITVGHPRFGLTASLHHWINDGLMAVFFFLVGLEIKREMLVGELASVRQAALPIAGAIGGMVVPALFYALLNAGGPGAAGWGIPMATDIAFALGVLSLLGPRVPVGIKVFLAALAIVDDIGAVLVIALFYTSAISWISLGLGGVVLALLLFLNRAGVRHPAAYAILGIVLWVAFLQSGVHATIAGVLLAMMIPARTRINEDEFVHRAAESLREFQAACGPGETVRSNRAQQEAVHALEVASDEVQSPLQRMEHRLQGIVAFGIVPLFALANAGVRLGGGSTGEFSTPIALGVVVGLVLGKPIGITLATWLAVRSGLAALPAGASWTIVHGVSWLGGIGFTMSLFIASLAFGDGALLDSAKLGILAASVAAGGAGWILLRRATGRAAPVDVTPASGGEAR
jgi:NhaA family Na+:H+ antiporter